MEQQTSSMTDEALLQQLGKQARMYVQSHTPINVEALPEAFETDITPRDTIFMRNNHDLLTIDAQEWQLTIDGAVEHPLILDYAALTALPRVKYVAFLECYGNGRKRFAELGTPAVGQRRDRERRVGGRFGCGGVAARWPLARCGRDRVPQRRRQRVRAWCRDRPVACRCDLRLPYER
jgi:DMSO/TMAO reductase YedYZ molybdopterin-dependent catalytic subunit